MSVKRRLITLARSELNALLDGAARLNSGDRDDDKLAPGRPGPLPADLSRLTDEELTAEIERRHRARTGGSSTGGVKTGGATRVPSDDVSRAYAALELSVGADFATVRRSYRALMRRYHPDRHAGTPEKQKAATELAQKLTAAYDLLEKRLQPR